jgi:hypothetical protein
MTYGGNRSRSSAAVVIPLVGIATALTWVGVGARQVAAGPQADGGQSEAIKVTTVSGDDAIASAPSLGSFALRPGSLCERLQALKKALTKSLVDKKEAADKYAKDETTYESMLKLAEAGKDAELTKKAQKMAKALYEVKLSDDEAVTLKQLGDLGTYVDTLCQTGGRPLPFYSLVGGVEGVWSDNKLADSSAVVDFAFSTPIGPWADVKAKSPWSGAWDAAVDTCVNGAAQCNERVAGEAAECGMGCEKDDEQCKQRCDDEAKKANSPCLNRRDYCADFENREKEGRPITDLSIRSAVPRLGPYLLPTPQDVAKKPFWFFTEVKTESLPDVTVGADGDVPAEANAVKNGKVRPSVQVGVQKFVFDMGETFGGFFGSFGTIIGDPPRNSPSADDRLFWSVGFVSQTKYRVADIDKKQVDRVLGQMQLSYTKLQYLADYTPKDSTEVRDDSDRLIADFRLTWGKLASETAAPFIYLTVDRSCRHTRKLQRDRIGFVVEIDLDKALGGYKAKSESK